jgi:hypothetical protein
MKKTEKSYTIINSQDLHHVQIEKDLSIKCCNRGKELIGKIVFGVNIMKALDGSC